MKKYTGGYCGLNPNFIISNLDMEYDKSNKLFGIFCVAKNLLLRGVPTYSSEFIQNKYPIIDENNNFFYCFSDKKYIFSRTIKGGIINPALDFYKEFCKRFQKENLFIIPECPLKDLIVDEEIKELAAVDFYIPSAKVVIEFDGIQHKDFFQKGKDDNRDALLRKKNISIFRISSEEWKNKQIVLDRLEKEISLNLEYGEFVTHNKIEDNIKRLVFIFRLQILLIELFSLGKLSLNNEEYIINIKTDIDINCEVANDAYCDIKELLGHLINLANFNDVLPDIKFNIVDEFSTNGINVNISIFDLYDEQVDSNNVICIANDYFFAQIKDACDDCFSEMQYKNYYQVSVVEDFRFENVDFKNNEHEKSLLYFLKLCYRYNEFLPLQLEIICSCLSSYKPVLGILPTGSGKSLCFQLASLLTPGISIVISPLKALMEDQCLDLDVFKISNINYINSHDCSGENRKEKILRFLSKNKIKILYISPERFFSNSFNDVINKIKNNICQFAIDEVHSLSEWGHDFRTSYLLLLDYITNLNINRLLLCGVTATASHHVIEDIFAYFIDAKGEPIVYSSQTFVRDELEYDIIFVHGEEAKRKKLEELISINSKNKGIYFFAYTNSVDENCRRYQAINSRIDQYHGRMDEEQKERVLKGFKEGYIDTIMATKAFGIGVNIADVLLSVHSEFSASIESIYQEMGRVGRFKKEKGLKKRIAKCYIIFDTSNYHRINILEKKGNELKIKDLVDSNIPDELIKQVFLIRQNNYEYQEEAKLILFLLHYIDKSKSNKFSLYEIKENCWMALSTSWKDYHYRENLSLKNSEYENIIYSANYSQAILELNKSKIFDRLRSNHNLSNFVERCLYRLYILGFIGLWKVEYSDVISNPIYNIEIIKQENESMRTKNSIIQLEKYIRKYQGNYEFDNGDANISDVINELCRWSYEQFFLTRWKSLRTLFQTCIELRYCEDKQKISSQFIGKINAYLLANFELIDAIKSGSDYNSWFRLLKIGNPEVLLMQVQRIIDTGDRDNYIIIFMKMLLLFKTNKFDRNVFSFQLREAIDAICRIYYKEIKDIFISIMKYLSKESFHVFLDEFIDYCISNKDEDLFSKIFNGYSKDLELIRLLYEMKKRLKENCNG